MDRALWLLLFLRTRAWVRRFARRLSSLKGVLLGVVGLMMFLPFLFSIFITPRIQTANQIASIRHFGPLGLFLYCLLNVLFSTGERAVTYSPAEINFLFCGPYRPRQILLYRIAGGTAAAFLTAVVMTFAFSHHASHIHSAWFGLFLALELLYLFSMTMGLLVGTLGALAFGFWRKGILIGLLLLIASVFYPLGQAALALPPTELAARLIANPIFSVLLLPCKPAVMTFASDHFLTEFLPWAALGLLVNGGLLVLNLMLNSQFLEVSASASAKFYARLQKARSGDLTSMPGKVRFPVPMLPRLGGVGPVFWRQLITASRTLPRLVALLLLFQIPLGVFMVASREANFESNVRPLLVMIVAIALFAPTMIGYDFRSDLERMEELKALPLSANSIVIGQLLTPLMILCLGEWLSLGMIVSVGRSIPEGLVSFAVALIPLNIILVVIENLYFLWFPFRNTAINALDVQSMGRQILLLFAKMITVGLIAGIAVLFGWFGYSLSGEVWVVGIVMTWFLMTTLGLALIPLVALAFVQYDVTEGAGDA